MAEYKTGMSQTKYREVSPSYRRLALMSSPEARAPRTGKQPTNPMTLDLLSGKTLFAFDPFAEEVGGKRKAAHGVLFSALYNTSRRFGMRFRCVAYDLPEDDHYRGYIMWMEDDEESKRLVKAADRALLWNLKQDSKSA